VADIACPFEHERYSDFHMYIRATQPYSLLRFALLAAVYRTAAQLKQLGATVV
jgi:hypothetical protein